MNINFKNRGPFTPEEQAEMARSLERRPSSYDGSYELAVEWLMKDFNINKKDAINALWRITGDPEVLKIKEDKLMKKIKIENEFQIPGTNVVLEAGDVIEINPELEEAGAPKITIDKGLVDAKDRAIQALNSLSFHLNKDSRKRDVARKVDLMKNKIEAISTI
jgi:hypothetical protein